MNEALELDLQEPISDSIWEVIINRIHSSLICIRHCQLQFKVFHCFHLTEAKLTKKISQQLPPMYSCQDVTSF